MVMHVCAMLKCCGAGGAVGAGATQGAAPVHTPGGRSHDRTEAERLPRRAGAGRHLARERLEEPFVDPDVPDEGLELLDRERSRRWAPGGAGAKGAGA